LRFGDFHSLVKKNNSINHEKKNYLVAEPLLLKVGGKFNFKDDYLKNLE
jgi:hypothetical protein